MHSDQSLFDCLVAARRAPGIAMIPESLLCAIEALSPQAIVGRASRGAISDGVELDTETNTRRASRYLADEAPKAVEGDGGDDTTFRVAARVKDFGVSETVALELMLEHWNDNCAPPWEPTELEVKIRNAYRYGVLPAGVADPTAEFEPVDLRPTLTGPQLSRGKRLTLEFAGDIQPRFDRPEVVADLLDAEAVSVLYGPSNSGKTFLALDLALHVADGRDWFGRKVRQGGVLYLAAEGAEGVRRRFDAFVSHYRVERSSLPFALLPAAVNLLDKKARQALDETVDAFRSRFGVGPTLVVIDTLARAMPGADENSGEAMGSLIEAVDALRRATGGHVLLVHHTGKDKAKGARGHSSLRAAVDTEIEVGDRGVARVTKQRDKELGAPIGFTLEPLTIGHTVEGREVTSCVVKPRSVNASEEFEPVPPQPGTHAHTAFGVLRRLVAGEGEHAVVPGVVGPVVAVGGDRWREECSSAGLNDRAVRRARGDLQGRGLIGCDVTRVWLLP